MQKIFVYLFNRLLGLTGLAIALMFVLEKEAVSDDTQPLSKAHKYESSSTARHFGEVQLQKMLSDRPQMKELIRRDDELWVWARAQFAFCDGSGPILWNAAPLSNAWPHYAEHSPKEPRFIRLSLTDPSGIPISSSKLWFGFIFEMFNLHHSKEFLQIEKELLAGKLDRDTFIERSAKTEYAALRDLADFYKTFYKEYAKRNYFPDDWVKLGVTVPNTYQSWIDQYTDIKGYPYSNYGSYYDTVMAILKSHQQSH